MMTIQQYFTVIFISQQSTDLDFLKLSMRLLQLKYYKSNLKQKKKDKIFEHFRYSTHELKHTLNYVNLSILFLG